MAYGMTRTRTYTGHNGTDWQRVYRILKRRMRKFLHRNRAWIILIGLPLAGMFAGLFIGVKATNYAQSVKLNDYGRQVVYTAYTVKPGDTIWGIAQDLAALNPEYNDIRQYVSAIEKLNKLGDGHVRQGQVILIPYYVGTDGVTDHNEIYARYGIGQ